MRLVVPLALFAALVLAAYAPASGTDAPRQAVSADTTWSWPSPGQNLQVLPADTSPEQLRDVMRGFTSALGVRCQFCHVGQPGTDFLTWDFASDAKSNKAVAREMMRMTWALNTETLPAIEGLREAEGMRVTCWTCHRGERTPVTTRPEE